MKQDLFAKLTAEEKETLTLCGISSQEQLLKSSVKQILRDIELAKTCFPEKHFTLTEARLNAIISDAAETEDNIQNTPSFVQFDELYIERKAPEVSFRHNAKREKNSAASKVLPAHHILHSPVRSSHPFLAVFSALSTLLLIVPAVSIPALIVLSAINNLPLIPLHYLAICLIIVPCIPFLILSRMATCPVCHMKIFSFSQYTRNRAAHHLPGLGYNIATALHTIFLLRYNCPACGTPVKLIGGKGRRIHH